MRLYLKTVVVAIVSICAVIGCSSGSEDAVVAVVDGEDVKLDLIERYFDATGYQFESPEEELRLKREALDSLIDYKLLVKGGYAAGLGTDPQIERLMFAERPTFLFDALYRAEVGSALEVTDEELEDFYERMGTEREVAHILVRREELADSLHQAIVDGADFGNVARQYSVDQATAVNGGHIGFITWGTNVVPQFRDVAFNMEVGAVSQPFQSDNGWHIVKLTDMRSRELMSKREMFPFLRQTIVGRKAALAERDFISGMKEKAAVQINPEATAMLMEKLDMFYPDTLSGVPRPENYFPQPELLEAYEQQTVFASYAGGELTVEGYLQKLEDVPDAYRPRFDNHEGLRDMIFQLELNNIMEYEAERRGTDISEIYQDRVETFRDGLVAEKFRRDVLGSNVDVTEDEILEYYNQNLDEYTTSPQYHVLEIEVTSMDDATAVLDKLQEGEDFAKLASEYTTRTGMRSINGDLGFVTETRFPELFRAAQKLDINDHSTIVVNSNGHYSIVKLLEANPKRVLPLEQVQGQVRSEIMELRRASAALDWLAQAREDASIQINDEILENSVTTGREDEQS